MMYLAFNCIIKEYLGVLCELDPNDPDKPLVVNLGSAKPLTCRSTVEDACIPIKPSIKEQELLCKKELDEISPVEIYKTQIYMVVSLSHPDDKTMTVLDLGAYVEKLGRKNIATYVGAGNPKGNLYQMFDMYEQLFSDLVKSKGKSVTDNKIYAKDGFLNHIVVSFSTGYTVKIPYTFDFVSIESGNNSGISSSIKHVQCLRQPIVRKDKTGKIYDLYLDNGVVSMFHNKKLFDSIHSIFIK